MKKISSIFFLIVLSLSIILSSCTENDVTPTSDPGRTGGGHGDF